MSWAKLTAPIAIQPSRARRSFPNISIECIPVLDFSKGIPPNGR